MQEAEFCRVCQFSEYIFNYSVFHQLLSAPGKVQLNELMVNWNQVNRVNYMANGYQRMLTKKKLES